MEHDRTNTLGLKSGIDPSFTKKTSLAHSITQALSHASVRRMSLSASITLASLLAAGPVAASLYNWNVATGDWNTAGNWDVGSVPPASAANYVQIDNGGTAQITGAVPTIGDVTIGNYSSGTLEIISGGSLTTNNNHGYLGSFAGSTGTVLIDGSGSSWSTGSWRPIIGVQGTGILTLTNGGKISSSTYLSLASSSGSTGTLNIGNGGAAGIVNTSEVRGGSGLATVNFNHTDADYFFTKDGTSGGAAVAITGSTSVNLIGTGKTTLTGNNTYTGNTTISAGTLQIGNGGTTGSITSDIINNSALIFNRSDTSSYGGTITGTGTFTKLGMGVLTLTGNNTYTGNTTISAGTLQIGNGGTTGSITSDIINNSALIFNRSDTSSYGGTISGTGSVTKQGTGTLTLSGSNSYSGGTIISAGILQVSADNQLGSGTLTLDGGTLRNTSIYVETNATILNSGTTSTIDASTALLYRGVISGDGNLTKTGTGTLALVGNNTYTGTTTISAGLLQIGAGETTGVIVGDIINNSELLFFRTNAYTHTGDVSGTGLINKLAGGTTTITGALTHTGGTTIGGGAFEIGNGGTIGSISGDITNNSALIFNRSDSVTYSDVISGTGTFTQAGTGNTKLTGVNTYSGATTVNAGTLSVNGSIANSATTVNTGATLGGSGTVGNVTLNSGGILAPGNSIGTLNVSGDVDFSAGGIYQVEVDAAGNSDKLIATGTATLTGGSVQVLPEAGTYNLSTDYTILTAGSIVGTFDSVSSSLAFLDPTLSYDSTNVYLNLTRNDVAFGDVANTPNQRAVGNTLTTIFNNGASGDMQTLINTVNTLTADGARQAYDSLSGIQLANAQSLLLSGSHHFANVLSSRSNRLGASQQAMANQHETFMPVRLAYNGNLSDLQLGYDDTATDMIDNIDGLWLTPQGGRGKIDDTRDASGADYNWYGIYGGMDKWLNQNFLMGVALGVSRTNANPENGDIDVDSVELATYGRWQQDNQYIDASIHAGRHGLDTSRQVTVGNLSRQAVADYDSHSVGVSIEAGQITFEFNETQITPFVGLSYTRVRNERFSEHGADSINLLIDSNSQTSLQSRLGLRIAHYSQTEKGQNLGWDASVAWAHELRDTASTLNVGFEGAPSTTFQIDGPELDRNRLQIGAGLTTNISQSTSLRIGYDGELASSDSRHSASANFLIKW